MRIRRARGSLVGEILPHEIHQWILRDVNAHRLRTDLAREVLTGPSLSTRADVVFVQDERVSLRRTG